MINSHQIRTIVAAFILAVTGVSPQPALARTAPVIKYLCQDFFSNQTSEGVIPLKQCGSLILIGPNCEGSRVLLTGEGENHSIGVRFQIQGNLASPSPKSLDHFHLTTFTADHSKEAVAFGNYNSVLVKTGSVMTISPMGIRNELHSYGSCSFIFNF